MVCPRSAELVTPDTTKGGRPRLRLGIRQVKVYTDKLGTSGTKKGGVMSPS
jgi:hypothetical protein